LATEWQVDNLNVSQAARKIEGASKSGEAEFSRRRDDANIVEFAIMADKSTYCGYVLVSDTAIGRKQRLRVTVADDDSKPPLKAGGLGGIFAKKAAFLARPDVVEKAVANLREALPPI
jgi:hypothetical protein